jgi:hypothetical protein
MIKYIGIDGCKSGWFYVGLDQAGNSSFGVFCEISKGPGPGLEAKPGSGHN